jgi:hypothetical protein
MTYSLILNEEFLIPTMRIIKTQIAILILLATTPALAQLKIGVSGGTVLSSLVRDSQLNARAGKVGYLVGANARLNLGELGWFVQSGITYTLEGDSDQSLNFLKVPIVLGLDISDDVNIHVAYDFAWQMSNDNNAQDFYNKTANILGLGAEINLGEKFAIGSKLNYGLSNLVKDPAGAKNYKIRPFTLELYLTYFFISRT